MNSSSLSRAAAAMLAMTALGAQAQVTISGAIDTSLERQPNWGQEPSRAAESFSQRARTWAVDFQPLPGLIWASAPIQATCCQVLMPILVARPS